MTATQRIIDFEGTEKHPLDVVADQEERKILYQQERDAKHGVFYSDEYIVRVAAEIADPERRLMFWEILSEAEPEAALYIVLRYCLGYSGYEVACGMGVSYARVKWLTNKVRRHVEQRDARAIVRAERGE
jgi:DNA-directed RNA polymerase specialized sigma24 family protein